MKTTTTLVFLLLATTLFSQTNSDSLITLDSVKADVKTLKERSAKMDKLLDFVRKFRFTGVIQPQFQHVDTLGAPVVGAGDFPSTASNRFSLRRGRFRIIFEHEGKKGFKIVEAVFHMDASERGFRLIDFYGRVNDPWTGWIGLQGGIFFRPFGFEVPFPETQSESAERARMSTIIFPGERELGYALVIESPTTFKPFYLRADASLVSGLGSLQSDIDNGKDFIGHLQARKTFGDKTKFTLSGGVSYYNGRVLRSTPTIYEIQPGTDGALRYTANVDSGLVNKRFLKREYYGADIQAALDYGVGVTTLRGEFITGVQPGVATASTVPIAVGSDLYVRNFRGAYFYFIQSFRQKVKTHTILHDFLFKFDIYDPNTRIDGKDLSTVNDPKVSRADVSYHTFSVGYGIRPYDWFRVQVNYDIVQNEKANISGFTRDQKDNVLTLRTSFYFDSKWFTK